MKIILVTGKVNSGKTSLMRELAEKEKKAGAFPAGILAPGIYEGKAKTGYDALDLSTGRSVPLARTGVKHKNGISSGKFVFSAKGLAFARKALRGFQPGGTVFLDEAGPLELRGLGHARSLQALLASPVSRLYVAVRDGCLKEFKKKFLPAGAFNVKVRRSAGMTEKKRRLIPST